MNEQQQWAERVPRSSLPIRFRWRPATLAWEYYLGKWGGWAVLRKSLNQGSQPMGYTEGLLFLAWWPFTHPQHPLPVIVEYEDTRHEALAMDPPADAP